MLHLFHNLYHNIESITTDIVKKIYGKHTESYTKLTKRLSNNLCDFYIQLSEKDRSKFDGIVKKKGLYIDPHTIIRLYHIQTTIQYEEFTSVYRIVYPNGDSDSHYHLSNRYEMFKNKFNSFYALMGTEKMTMFESIVDSIR